jgi:thiosulfate/3-mercaptopyruvate sulfurtransferase
MAVSEFPHPVINVNQLKSRLDDPALLLLDGTMLMPTPQGKQQYQPQQRIGKARYFDFDSEICDQESCLPHMMPSAEQFQRQVRALGINQQSEIVVYDAQGLFSAARVWWMFRAMGHQQVSVLDGGLPAWLRVGYPTCPININETYPQGDFIAQPQPALFCDASRVEAALTQKEVKVVDARASDRFYGRVPEPRAGMRSGHMPGAVNLPYASLLDNRGCLLPLGVLQNQFAQQVGEAEHYIFSCGSGVTACILALVADLLGYPSLSVYDGSWSEWGASTRPVTQD